MANDEHLKILKKGVEAWNKWRIDNPQISPDLSGADLNGADLRNAYLDSAILSRANLGGANLERAYLSMADLTEADLTKADLFNVKLVKAELSKAVLSKTNLMDASIKYANLNRADLSSAVVVDADLTLAKLSGAILRGALLHDSVFKLANLSEADLTGADLTGADLRGANLANANLSGADLSEVTFVRTNLAHADLTDCRVYGISAWDLSLEGTMQLNLAVTRKEQPTITVDNLEIAQFVYLLLNNKKIRDVIDTMTGKAVLLLGRFTSERKATLDIIRDKLRQLNYLPILFDFDKPSSRDLTETIRTLAHLSRFIIADITEPRSIPQELQAIVPDLAIPVQPLLLQGSTGEYAMFRDLRRKYHWVLTAYEYSDVQDLLSSLDDKVIAPAEAKVIELRD